MDTLTAFARGEASRDQPAMVFDWDKAASIIRQGRVSGASAGLRDDWDWTGGPILRWGEPVSSEDTYVYLASTWAPPELSMESPDGTVTIPCWRYEDETGWGPQTYWPESALAILRGGQQT